MKKENKISKHDKKVEPPVVTEDQTFKAVQLQFKSFAELTSIHIESYLISMTNTRLTQKQKAQSAHNLAKAIKATLFQGTVDKLDLPNSGHGAKDAKNLAGVFAQALELKMLALAYQHAAKDEKASSVTEEETHVES